MALIGGAFVLVGVLVAHVLTLWRARSENLRVAREKFRASLSVATSLLAAQKDPHWVLSQHGVQIDAAILQFGPYVSKRHTVKFKAAAAKYAACRTSVEPALLVYLRAQAGQQVGGCNSSQVASAINELWGFAV